MAVNVQIIPLTICKYKLTPPVLAGGVFISGKRLPAAGRAGAREKLYNEDTIRDMRGGGYAENCASHHAAGVAGSGADGEIARCAGHPTVL